MPKYKRTPKSPQLPLPGFKICYICKRPIPYSDLKRNKNESGGVSGICKKCHSVAIKKYADKNRAKINARRRELNAQHPERKREADQRYYYSHQEQLQEYRQRDKKKRSDQFRNWYSRNRKTRTQYKIKYYHEHLKGNPEYKIKHRQYDNVWAKRYPERVRAIQENKRAKRKNAEGYYTDTDVKNQYAAQQGKCYWCSEELGNRYAMDHVIPINKGGSNWLCNLVCACVPCNSRKSDKIPYEEWQPPQPLYPGVIPGKGHKFQPREDQSAEHQ